VANFQEVLTERKPGVGEAARLYLSAAATPTRFRVFMVAASLLVFVLGCWVDPAGLSTWSGLAVLLPLTVLPSVFRENRGQHVERDAAFALPWIALLVFFMSWIIGPCGILRPVLYDATFAHFDRLIGISVPAIARWTAAHRLLEAFSMAVYLSITPLIVIASLCAPLFGKRKSAEMFAASNMVALLLALPFFILFPAIGPWFDDPSIATPHQQAVRAFMARAGTHMAAGISFPSFHVIWAVLSAAALCRFRWLRVPAAILAALIIASTLTTAWHYAIDVIGGLVIASISLVAADWITTHR
jgi:membrane-associated phospholipid phosphatase